MVKKIVNMFVVFTLLISLSSYAAQPAEQLLRDKSDPSFGNPKAKVTIVEFFDYLCTYCVSMSSTLSNILKKNPDVRVVFKEYPIRGQLSEVISRAALASQKQGKYYEFHYALMGKAYALNETSIYQIAKSVGIDVVQLKKDMYSQDVTNQVKANYDLADQLNIVATPAFYIGKTGSNNVDDLNFELGSMSQRTLQNSVNLARK